MKALGGVVVKEADSQTRVEKQIVVYELIYPETTLRIAGTSFLVRNNTRGPVEASLKGKAILLEPTSEASSLP